jgi:hypothetical protein
MAMELGEYFDLLENLAVVNKIDSKREEKPELSLDQQISMIKRDPAIRKQ